MKEYRIIEHNGLYFKFMKGADGWFLNAIDSEDSAPKNDYVFLPFVLCERGMSVGSFGGDDALYKNNLGPFKEVGFEYETDKFIKINYHSETMKCRVEVLYTLVENAPAFYQSVTLTAEEDITITDFYACFPVAGYQGEENSDYTLSYRRNRWEAEGQWYEQSIKELGFVEYNRMPALNKFTVSSVSSQTTGNFYPCMILKHTPSGKTWFLENEADGCWLMELSEYRPFCEREIALCLSGGNAEERVLAYSQTLKKGESRSTPISLFAVSSGKENILRSVYTAKRSVQTHAVSTPTVFFNDYMNCVWAAIDYETEKTLIDAAAEFGADYFIIDDGWFAYKQDVGDRLGDWNTDGEVFGDEGLKGILAYIQNKGMKAGIWIEFEVAGKNSVIGREHPDWLITVDGKIFGADSRRFLDFRKYEVWEYLFARVQAVYDLGVRYIKTDFNDTYSEVDAANGERRFGLYENYAAVRAFYQEVCRKFPNIILENCASGGKREDNGILKYFNLQSISDQEETFNYPSIIGGCYINNVPEKTGIWVMPYPKRFYEREKPLAEIQPPQDDEVIFGLVNGLAGLICLSTHLELLSEKQKNLVKEMIATYKFVFPILMQSYPEYPLGLTHVGDKQHALLFKGTDVELLYLWATGESEFEIREINSFEQIFPKEKDCMINDNKIILPSKTCARLFMRKRLK